MDLKGRTDLFDLHILDSIHKHHRMGISHGYAGKAVFFSVHRDRLPDLRCLHRAAHIHRNKLHLSVLHFHGKMLDPGRCLYIDLRLIYDSVIVSIFPDTADPISAHCSAGSIQIIHIHLAVGSLRRLD